MSWAKLEGRIAWHRKTLLAKNEAFGAWVRMLAHAAESLTNGIVSETEAMAIAERPKVIKTLLEVGFLEKVPEGYKVHDYHHYNPHSEAEKERRAAIAKKRSEAGKEGARGRWQNGKTDGKRSGKASGKPDGNSDGKGHGKKMPPYPYTVNSPSESLFPPTESAATAEEVQLRGPSDHQRVIAAYSEAFKRLKGKSPVIGKKGGKAASDLLAVMSVDDCIEAIENAFRDTWFVDTQCELWAIANSPNKYRGRAQRRSSGVHAVQRAPAEGRAWKYPEPPADGVTLDEVLDELG